MQSKSLLIAAFIMALAAPGAFAQSPEGFFHSLVPQPPPSLFDVPPEAPWKAPRDFVFGWTPPVMDVLTGGNAERGQQVAEKRKCAKCHGDTGISDEDDLPSLAGQTSAYLFKQLVDYKTQRRENRSMKKAVRKLSPRDMADLGAFYAVQQAEPAMGGEVPPLVDKGDRSRLLLACNDCHNESQEFRSMMEIPATLKGQKIDYLIETLNAFKTGERANDLFGRMRFIASRLTDEEITALATYYAAQPIVEE